MKQICHWLCLLLVVASCTADKSAEMEKVIAYYRDSVPDEEKLYAALFLRDNMDAHYSMESEAAKVFRREVDSLFTYDGKMEIGECRKAYDSLLLKYRNSATELVEYYDMEHLKAEFLIAHIDSLFRVWREAPWVEDYDLEHFCNYVLPYRVGKEPVSEWYGQYRAISQKRMEGYTNIQRNRTHKLAVLEDVRGNLRQENYFPSTYVPELPLTSLPTMRLGSCEEYAVYCTALLRAYGLPAAVDFTPQWGNRSMGHSWTVYLPASGEVLPFASDDPIAKHFYRRQTEYMPKVFRHTFARQPEMAALQQLSDDDCPELFRTLCLLDVTGSYIATSDVDVPLFSGIHDKVIYLAVFDNQRWSIVHYAKRRGLRARFSKMGRGIVYLPVTYSSSDGISPAGHPFILHADGDMHPLLADTTKREEVILHRKYKSSGTLETWAERLCDAEFQVATSSDYSDAMPIIRTGDSIVPKFNLFDTDYEGDYRHLRFISTHSWGEVAELELYGDSGKVFVPIHSGGHNVKDLVRCFDGDPLSFSGNRRAGGARIEMEFSQPIHIDSLRLLPRNDDNFIREGEQYELYYWDGRSFASIARMEGNREGVLYVDNVPTNALLLLRNHTKGKEERIFTYENGEQVWW